jgi:hypothetical protein
MSIYINTFLTLLWMLGFALLCWNLWGTLTHQCSIENWEHDTGVMVCMIYKALTVFSATGMYVIPHMSFPCDIGFRTDGM